MNGKLQIFNFLSNDQQSTSENKMSLTIVVCQNLENFQKEMYHKKFGNLYSRK